MMASEPAKIGRYAPIGPQTSLVDVPRKGMRLGGKIEIVHGQVDEPNRDEARHTGRTHQRVAINRRIDWLENEFSRGRVSDGAHRAGRHIDKVFAKAGPSLGATFDGSGGHATPYGIATKLCADIEAAQVKIALLADMEREIGEDSARWLGQLCGEGLELRLVAMAEWCWTRGRMPNDYQAHRLGKKIGAIAREDLERLSAAWDLRGFER